MRSLLHAVFVLSTVLACTDFVAAALNTHYQWRFIDYQWESYGQKYLANKTGLYAPKKIIPYDVQRLSDGRVLVTTPRYFNNPASLSVVSQVYGSNGPLLAPYPNWRWHDAKDCSGITSVNRIRVDECDRLWIVDSGKIGNEQICPAKILQFDTKNDRLVQQIEIPKELSRNPDDKTKGRLELQTVETAGESCAETWVYVSDLEGYGLIIWDGEDIWRLNDDVFKPDPNQTTFSVGGENFTLSLGPSGFLIGPDGYLKDRYAFFKPLSANKGYAVSTADLHNSKLGGDVIYYITEYTAPSQELGRDFSKLGGFLIAGFTTETLVACWNIQYPLEDRYIGFLEQNATTLQYINSIKITLDRSRRTETVDVLTNRLQKFVRGTMNFNEINFRILSSDVRSLINGTICAPRGNHSVEKFVEAKGFRFFDINQHSPIGSSSWWNRWTKKVGNWFSKSS
ncbi:major royal jelly protein 1-like [Athalia rosae]|uniref:major royal jelly protein 1-like n=1 Tax=Athalia rosae TaxID=37344 RepID=UPI002033F493|nr:major royal jelly protein 1-like [Athalia rosae]